jgi:hypothetical protein
MAEHTSKTRDRQPRARRDVDSCALGNRGRRCAAEDDSFFAGPPPPPREPTELHDRRRALDAGAVVDVRRVGIARLPGEHGPDLNGSELVGEGRVVVVVVVAVTPLQHGIRHRDREGPEAIPDGMLERA